MKMEEVKRQARQRRAQIAAMRYNGMTYKQIGEALGITRQRAHEVLNGRADERQSR